MKNLVPMRFPFLHRIVAFFAMLLGVCGGAIAADMPTKAPIAPAPAIPGWTFSLTPYFWAVSLNGPLTVKGRTADVDVGFFDILEHTQFPTDLFELAALGEARYGRFALLTDIVYLKAGIGASVVRSRGTDAINGTVGASAGLKIWLVAAEFAGAYEIGSWRGLFSPGSSTALDLYAGGRVWWQRGEVDLTVTGTLNVFDLSLTREGALSAVKSVSWVDPLVGARIRHQFAPTWDFVLSGDVGGFGVGSQFSWQALALLEHEIRRSNTISWNAMVGYKALNANYSQGSGLTLYNYDLTIHGPIFGVTARF